MQFFWAMVDASHAALIGLNIIPLIVFSLFVGMAFGRGHSWLKAFMAVVPAVLIAAVWPLVYGAGIIWPDFGQMETAIQLVVLYALGVAIIALVGNTKQILAPIDLRKPAISES